MSAGSPNPDASRRGTRPGTNAPGSASSAPSSAKPATPEWLRWTICIIAAILYSYDMWAGLASLVTLGSVAGEAGGSAWIALVGAIVAPIVAYAAAFWISRRMVAWAQALVFFAGLAVMAALVRDIEAAFRVVTG